MYRNDPESRVVEFDGVPQCDVGSPSPQIFAYEHGLLLAYLVQRKSGIPLTVPDTYAVVRFVRPLVHIFGWPNDEVLQAHPLYNNGLESYASYEILQSPWIKQLEITNAVHPSISRVCTQTFGTSFLLFTIRHSNALHNRSMYAFCRRGKLLLRHLQENSNRSGKAQLKRGKNLMSVISGKLLRAISA